MKKILSGLTVLTFMTIANVASAFWVQNYIFELGSYETDSGQASDYVVLDSDSKLGACLLTPEGRNIYAIKKDAQGNRMMAQLIAAKIDGRKVVISFTGAKDAQGRCITNIVKL